ncbi:GGDEF domain-containing protein [Rhodococcus sp. RS1C4]|uniref:GGDEF domain-containing protein n=1 Tax=Nocardiaceae TaxID=85025 RepID=UPI00037A1C45|nr:MULTISPECIES: GGDEF domain-containing protein [Rhodococcus]OZC55656.1 GGDEF domain-containing protein [Rhodococcus sp. 06-621-2]OZC58775.1 GGDEF domain-containing protein [Rhodococcus sp. RS1C4]OZD07532.1 GGDEF domain-containing protein [Rhodococcus sp. 06-156-4C]OZD17260.1 GGDEF domain-containing protein [Rhodococcus sp. 06-156-3C]OZD18597.1 GGDEF domain-containing protein [Rhodococcus sp. 06-156-4a]
MSVLTRRSGVEPQRSTARFDTRTAMVIASATGALPLLAIAMISPTFLKPGAFPLLCAIVGFTALTVVFALKIGRLTDLQFAILGSGGMVGVAISAYLIADPSGTRAVTSMLAVVPAIAAAGSPPKITAAVTAGSVILATWLSSITLSDSGLAVTVVAVGAAATTVLVPVVLIAALRRSLLAVNGRLSVLANTDPLTRLLNRRGMLSQVEALLDKACISRGRLWAYVVDIDHFKSVNDTLGHAAGDRVLVTIAEALRHATARTGSQEAIVSRIGGEEFLILTELQPRTPLENAILDSVRAECEVTVSVGSVTVDVRAALDPRLNFGAASESSHVEHVVDTIMHAADNALYDAKSSGRDQSAHAGAVLVTWEAHTPEQRSDLAAEVARRAMP